MATAIRNSMTDNSVKDNTNDAINGTEVDANPNALADILDGTTDIQLGGAGAMDFEAIRILETADATNAVQTAWTYEWNPADSENMTDGSSGLGMVFKMPDDADAQNDFARINIICLSDAAGAEVARMDFYLSDGSGAPVSQMQLTNGALVPTTTDDISLGTSSLNFSDLFLDSGAVVNFNSGDVTVTHSSNTLTVAGGTWATAALTASTITGSGILAVTDATEATNTTTASLKTAGGIAWVKDAYVGDDMFFTSDAVLNWAAGDVTLTHAAGKLTFGGDGAVELDFNNHEMTNVDINSGAIDGTIIGGASVAAGSFAAVVGTTITGSGVLSIDDTTDTTSGTDGSIHTDGGLGIAKALWVAGVTTHGGNVVSDQDSADDLGTTSARWANLFVDSLGDTGQDLTIAATTVNFPTGAVLDFNSDVTITHSSNTLTLGGATTLALGATNLTTTGTIASGVLTHTDGVIASNAAGPQIVDEAATATNPTLVPNKAELDTGFGWGASDTLTAVTGGAERVRIDSAGNVGIGTTSPLTNLSVQTSDATTSSPPAAGIALESAGASTLWFGADSGETALQGISWGDAADNDTGRLYYQHSTNSMQFTTNAVERMRLNDAGAVYINEDVNTFMDIGLTINQGGGDKEVLAFKSSDILHGVSANTEIDTYGRFKKHHATEGGLQLEGFSGNTDTSAGTTGLFFRGSHMVDNTTKGAGALGQIMFQASLRSGTGDTTPGTDANLLVIRSHGAAKFIFDQEGQGHSVVAWTTFAKHDDISIINDMESELLLHEDDAKTDRRHALEDLGVIGKDSWHMENDKPRAMVNFTKLSMLHHGALIQIGKAYEDLKRRLETAEQKLALTA